MISFHCSVRECLSVFNLIRNILLLIHIHCFQLQRCIRQYKPQRFRFSLITWPEILIFDIMMTCICNCIYNVSNTTIFRR